MEKRTLYIVITVVLLVTGAVIIGLFVRTPEVSVSGAAISSLNLSTISLNITLTVDSPYPVAIPLKAIDYSVFYNGKSPVLLAAGGKQGIILTPGSQSITIPVIISNPGLIDSLREVLISGEIRLTVSGNITPELLVIAPTVPFSKEIITPVNPRDIISGSKVLSGIGTLAGKILGY